ncbi:MAG: DNA polymerase [Pyrinomonadaceae bacterium]
MKAKRAEFDKETFDDVLAYCLEECRYMAELARKLIDAHFAAGLKLKSFYGAGSSASAMLDIMKIRDKVKDPPEEMLDGVYRAFFGGRFEHSVIGPIEGPIYSYDISSAYPYQLYFLPCLIHGTWHHTTNRNDIDHARAAVIRYSLGKPRLRSWAPFPFRTSDGAIAFPTRSGGGWVWKEEYLEGEALCPTTLFHEAWILETTCDCRPFEKIPHYYRERLRIGKEGPGIALKLGMNSCYGKLAQSVGNAPFNSWVWAGMITSGTRAQILNTMRAHRVLSNLYMVATDGIQTKEHLSLGLPQDTGTFDTPKPLGGWEEKIIEKGVFYARPGIYFPLNPTEQEIKEIKARGLGKGVLLEAWPKVVESWNNHRDSEQASIADVSRFCGAKSCVSRRGKLGSYVYRRADALDGKLPSYGQWVTREIALSFHPMPKRESINDDNTLKLRKLGNVLSAPYSKAVSRKSKEGQVMGRAKLELSEQPDYDYADYE